MNFINHVNCYILSDGNSDNDKAFQLFYCISISIKFMCAFREGQNKKSCTRGYFFYKLYVPVQYYKNVNKALLSYLPKIDLFKNIDILKIYI